MRRVFESTFVGDTADKGSQVLILASPDQLLAAMDDLSPTALRAFLLLLKHGYQEGQRVEVAGWGASWLREHGMNKYASEKAASELREKGYIRCEQGPDGVLGKMLGVVPQGLITDAPDPVGPIRARGGPAPRAVRYRLSAKGGPIALKGRCSVCGGTIPATNGQRITYIVARGKYVKIGSTASLASRLPALATDTLSVRTPDDFDPETNLRVLGVSSTAEHALHAAFAAQHVIGEWFLPDQEMLDRIAEEVTSIDQAASIPATSTEQTGAA